MPGGVAVVEALLSVLAPGGTLVVPTHTSDLSDPAGWSNPPVPESWWPTIRATMPAFRPAVSPSRAMGAIPEVVRSWPGAWRSDHPHVSFAALGPDAAAVTGGHRLADGLGEGSPLARLYELDAAVLLLGVGHAATPPCTWPSTGPASARWSPSPDPSSGRSSACGSAGLTSTSTRSSSRLWEPTWSAPGW